MSVQTLTMPLTQHQDAGPKSTVAYPQRGPQTAERLFPNEDLHRRVRITLSCILDNKRGKGPHVTLGLKCAKIGVAPGKTTLSTGVYSDEMASRLGSALVQYSGNTGAKKQLEEQGYGSALSPDFKLQALCQKVGVANVEARIEREVTIFCDSLGKGGNKLDSFTVQTIRQIFVFHVVAMVVKKGALAESFNPSAMRPRDSNVIRPMSMMKRAQASAATQSSDFAEKKKAAQHIIDAVVKGGYITTNGHCSIDRSHLKVSQGGDILCASPSVKIALEGGIQHHDVSRKVWSQRNAIPAHPANRPQLTGLLSQLVEKHSIQLISR